MHTHTQRVTGLVNCNRSNKHSNLQLVERYILMAIFHHTINANALDRAIVNHRVANLCKHFGVICEEYESLRWILR